MEGFSPRPAQEQVLAYTGGMMGVSAVPGAGKTVTLARLAADLVRNAIGDEQEVLVVTLVNSAVENIRTRIGQFIGEEGLLAGIGYRVRTLHGLAHDIVRESPGLVGLADGFAIVDERTAEQILEGVVDVWLRGNPDAARDFLSADLADGQREWAESTQWPEAVRSLAQAFVRRAKDLNQPPEALRARLPSGAQGAAFALAQTGAAIYEDYQRGLHYRGGVDFDDLILLARRALDLDADLLERLRHRWPFILEDEAQDSSEQQQEILSKLAGPRGNWVRVGDPNQAINTTFTTADPRYLREFLSAPDVRIRPLPNSGRSQACIIDLANYLTQWTARSHPESLVRSALTTHPQIEPTPPGDPQPNPEADPSLVRLVDTRYSPERETEFVVDSVFNWLRAHPDESVAILVPRNQRGFQVTDALRHRGVPYLELLRSTTSTRRTAGALGNVLNYLGTPSSAPLLARALEVWRREDRNDRERAARLRQISSLVRQCPHVESYLWPHRGRDWLDEIEWVDQQETDPRDGTPGKPHAFTLEDRSLLSSFRDLVCRWQQATVLAVDQLVLTIAQDLFTDPGQLALSHKLAVLLRSASEQNPTWRLPELTTELAMIARNQRRFLGFLGEDSGITAETGKVTVSTLHKAKGLEWDRVYLMSVNNYDFPSGQPQDEYIGEKWFIRGRLNLEAEALAQLLSLVDESSYVEGQPTLQARLDYVAERLRLLYVGITRARKELVVTWNTGRSREAKVMAVPFIALHTWWNDRTEQ